MINSRWFLHAIVHEIMRCNASHSHLPGSCKKDSSDYLLSEALIYERIEQTFPSCDENSKAGYGITTDFWLFAPSNISENQISTTISTLLRVRIAIPICWAQGKVENEYVFVSLFMIDFACFTFDASTSENEYCVIRQSSYFQPEGSLCDGH